MNSLSSYRQFVHDKRVSELSEERRKLLAPFVARMLSIAPVTGGYLGSLDVVRCLEATLGLSVSIRTIQNYLGLKTRTEAYLIPRDFKKRLAKAHVRPKAQGYSLPDDLIGLFRLLDDVVRECDNDPAYDFVTDTALDEIELLRADNLMQFDVQKPRRISPDQPALGASFQLSTELCDSPHFDFRDELSYGLGQKIDDELESLPQLVSLRSYRKVIDREAYDFPGWWQGFTALKTDSIPVSVQRLLRPDDAKRPRSEVGADGYPWVPANPTMREMLLWQKLKREYVARQAALSEDALFLAYRDRGEEPARAFFERMQPRFPAGIKSLRTFERRYAAWRESTRVASTPSLSECSAS